MATVNLNIQTAAGPWTAVVNGANDYILQGNMAQTQVSRWVIEFTNDNTFVGSCVTKARMLGQGQGLQQVPYIGLSVNATVGTGLPVATAITTTSLIEVPAEEMEVSFSCTSFTSGSGTLRARPVAG